MRKLLFLLILWCGSAIAQSAANDIEFDFGTIASSNIVSHDFTFNEEIRAAVATCECVQVTVTQKRKNPPVFIVHVEFDPKDYRDDISQEVVVVDTNDTITNIKLRARVFNARP